MKLSRVGALVGAGVGAVVRGGFTLFNLAFGDGAHAALALVAFLPSVVVGALSGGIAGALGKAGWGALIGAGISVGLFGLCVLPWAVVLERAGAAGEFTSFSWPYFLQKGFAGAIAGAIGGYIGGRSLAARAKEQVVSSMATQGWRQGERPDNCGPPSAPGESAPKDTGITRLPPSSFDAR
jgi:hypothetical protein